MREVLDELKRVAEKGVTGMTPKKAEMLKRWLALANRLKGYKARSFSDLITKAWSELENNRTETVKLLGGRLYFDWHKTSAKIAVAQLRNKGL